MIAEPDHLGVCQLVDRQDSHGGARRHQRGLRAIDPRIRLLPINHSSFELIDRAAAVATVTGSAGWEAVCRGKPVITLGYAWYNGCEGVFYAPRREQCREALARVADGYRVDQEKVRYFLHVYDQHCLPACADPIFVKEFDLTPRENAELLADAVGQACRQRLACTSTQVNA